MFAKTIIRQGNKIMQLTKELAKQNKTNKEYSEFIINVSPVMIETKIMLEQIKTELLNIQEIDHNGMTEDVKRKYRNKYINDALNRSEGIIKELDRITKTI